MDKYYITINRQFGSLGRPIARKISSILGIEYYDRDIVGRCADFILKDHKNCMNISIYAPKEARFENCIKILKAEIIKKRFEIS